MPIRKLSGFNRRAIEGRINRAKRAVAEIGADEFIEALEEITANWEHKPTFTKTFTRNGVKVDVEDNEAGDIFKWVNFGTGEKAGGSRYEIKPKKPGGVLSFTLGYTPKTTRSSYGGSGTASGPQAFAKKVVHKGIEPRRLDLQAKKKVQKQKLSISKVKRLLRAAIFGRSN